MCSFLFSVINVHVVLLFDGGVGGSVCTCMCCIIDGMRWWDRYPCCVEGVIVAVIPAQTSPEFFASTFQFSNLLFTDRNTKTKSLTSAINDLAPIFIDCIAEIFKVFLILAFAMFQTKNAVYVFCIKSSYTSRSCFSLLADKIPIIFCSLLSVIAKIAKPICKHTRKTNQSTRQTDSE